MNRSEQAISTVAGFLSDHRHEPPERDGWYSLYEIQVGIKEDNSRGLSAGRIVPAVDFLLNVEPPAVEDTWMRSGENGLPNLDEHYTRPDLPKGARRYYRALGSATNHVVVEEVNLGVNLAW